MKNVFRTWPAVWTYQHATMLHDAAVLRRGEVEMRQVWNSFSRKDAVTVTHMSPTSSAFLISAALPNCSLHKRMAVWAPSHATWIFLITTIGTSTSSIWQIELISVMHWQHAKLLWAPSSAPHSGPLCWKGQSFRWPYFSAYQKQEKKSKWQRVETK